VTLWHRQCDARMTPNGRAFSGEPSEQRERPERMRGRRVRCNAMLGGRPRNANNLAVMMPYVLGCKTETVNDGQLA
jgi:hypothetical protein